jgi:pyruvate,water dikinase
MGATQAPRRGFPSPFEVPTPPSAEGWQEMYAYHALFGEERRDFEESRFWFQDAVHYAEPVPPFDALLVELLCAGFGQAAARLFVLPSSVGMEYRLLNGYVYVSVNAVTDEAAVERRAQLFARRGGYYYRDWDELYDRWRTKIEEAIAELEAIGVPDLPEFEDEDLVTEGRGLGSGHALLDAYAQVLRNVDRVMHYHFELLNLGYAAYVVFYELCRRAFAGIRDDAIARMVSGAKVLAARPDDELRRLARRAVELGVTEGVRGATGESELADVVGATEPGARWLAEFEATKHPWFYFSYGNGLYSHHRSWIDDPSLPIAAIGTYIERLEAGEDLLRTSAAVGERDRITGEYRALLAREDRAAFDDALALARTVFPFVEDHGFYVEHWYLSIFWDKVREFGRVLARHRFIAEPDDVFFLRYDEVRHALEELRIVWSAGGEGAARGPWHWPPIVARRSAMLRAVSQWPAPPALGVAPDVVTDPIAIMLFGMTDERVGRWLGSQGGPAGERALVGVAGSPGVAEGSARLVFHPDELDELARGEILVAPSTSPSWTPAFDRVGAAVLDTGGIMSHAAIVAREYGMPAVVGTGTATRTIRTGDRLRVDGDAGIVTLLD